MPKFEFAVKAFDSEDLESGHKRSKKGDIIAYKPYPWKWGSMESPHFLIVIMDNLTEEEAEKMCKPYYEGGVETFDIENGQPEIIAKRRYKIDLDAIKKDILPELDMAKVENASYVYQPFKKEADVKCAFIKEMATPVEVKPLSKEVIDETKDIEITEELAQPVDCGESKDEEFSIDAKTYSNIIIDKHNE
jgi:hypothetical protein